MVQVSVTINGRQFRMACEDGEEAASDAAGRGSRPAHREAARALRRDRRHAAHRDGGAHPGRRASETKEKLQRFEPELASLQDARVQSAERAKATQAAVSAALNSAAERIEGITRRLNETLRDDNVAMG